MLLGRSAIFAGWIVGGVGAALGAAGVAAVIVILPLKTTEWRMLAVDRTTGFISKPLGLEDAPVLFGQATEEHYLEQFLRAREGWIYDEDRWNDHVVKIMLSPGQQGKYQDWRKLPTSPMVELGHAGHIDVDDIHYYPRSHADDPTKNYLLTFDRTTWRSTQKLSSEVWAASVSFQWHPELPMKPADRDINPGGMVIIDYTSGRR